MKVYKIIWEVVSSGRKAHVATYYTEKGLAALSVRLVGSRIHGESGVLAAMKHHQELRESGRTLVEDRRHGLVAWTAELVGDQFEYDEEKDFVTLAWVEEALRGTEETP